MPVSRVQKLRLSACWRMDASVGKKLPAWPCWQRYDSRACHRGTR